MISDFSKILLDDKRNVLNLHPYLWEIKEKKVVQCKKEWEKKNNNENEARTWELTNLIMKSLKSPQCKPSTIQSIKIWKKSRSDIY